MNRIHEALLKNSVIEKTIFMTNFSPQNVFRTIVKYFAIAIAIAFFIAPTRL